MRGIKSQAMVLAASDSEHTTVSSITPYMEGILFIRKLSKCSLMNRDLLLINKFILARLRKKAILMSFEKPKWPYELEGSPFDAM